MQQLRRLQSQKRSTTSNLVSRGDSVTYSIPSAWRRPSSNISVEDSLELSRAVVETLIALFNTSSGIVEALGGGQTALLLNSISLLDYKAGTSHYHDVVTQNILTAVATLNVSTQSFTTDSTEWGLSAIRAYRAYNDTTMLNTAKDVWNQLVPYFVTADDATQGVHALGNTPIAQECNGSTTAGAVFWVPGDLRNTVVNVETVGAFSALSGLLFESTRDPQHQVGAELSAEFLKNHWYDGEIIRDSLDIRTCGPQNTFKLCYNSGKTLEATSILAARNQSLLPFLSSLVATATPFPSWTGSDGVNTEGVTDITQNGFGVPLKAFFVRGLYETWERTSNPSMANYIEGYLNVQFNALRDLANSPGTDQYSPTWTIRPPVSPLLPGGQLTALDVLSSQVGFARRRATTSSRNNTSTVSLLPSDTPTPTTADAPTNTAIISPASKSATHTNEIVGAIVGCLGIIFLILGVLWWFIRRRRRAHNQLPSVEVNSPLSIARHTSTIVTPFTTSVSTDTRTQNTKRGGGTSGWTAALGSSTSNAYADESSSSHAAAPSGRYGTEGTLAQQSSSLEHGLEESEIRRRATLETREGTVPEIIQLLQAIVTRLPSESVHQAPPSYYSA